MASLARRVGGAVAAVLNQPVPLRHTRAEVPVAGKRILITGASSGIGRAAALAAADAGAEVVLVARREPELAGLAAEIHARGGQVRHRACDLTDTTELDALLEWVRTDLGTVDVLVNNAGKSIRRPVTKSLDRIHDFQRTMDINYFGPVRLTLGLLPAMLDAGAGHVVNIGTWTVPTGTSPRFAAYHSSKMALTGLGHCLDAELSGRGIAVTTIHYPLVHTEMSAPTPEYRELPGLTPEQAAEWIITAVRHRPVQVIPRFVPLLRALYFADPRAVGRLLSRTG
ncbi:SDR family NAD(P)-dependent oxidoreductase [Nocardia sp. NPDC004415]